MSDFTSGIPEDELGEGNEGLIEVDIGDDAPPDDDSSTVWGTEIDDNEEYIDQTTEPMQEVVDMSVCSFSRHGQSVYCVAIHPSIPGVVITGGGDDMGYIWTYESSQSSSFRVIKEVTLDGHKDTVSTVSFNHDGVLALTGSFDGTIRVWETTGGGLKTVLEGPEDIEWAEWHPKGNAIVAGSNDGTIWMWLVDTNQCLQVFSGHDGKVTCGMFSKDGKFVISGGEDGTIRVWMPKTGIFFVKIFELFFMKISFGVQANNHTTI